MTKLRKTAPDTTLSGLPLCGIRGYDLLPFLSLVPPAAGNAYRGVACTYMKELA
jgi:hypothetical protein